MKTTYHIEAITPIFSYGADPFRAGNRRAHIPDHDGSPEIRPASIRGQLRWWMEALGYGPAVATIFGTTAGDQGTASKVRVRVDGVSGPIARKCCTQHKDWSVKTCYDAGTTFYLEIAERRNGLNEEERLILTMTVEAWLLLGTLGGRGTRAAGSLARVDQVLTEGEWKERCIALLKRSNFQLRLGREAFKAEADARHIVCDTLHETAFQDHKPLGGIGGGRKTSPLRMRVVRFADAPPETPYRIAALWTLADRGPLQRAIQVLCNRPKNIGKILHNADVIVA
jgi:CRISPR type III-B/RAMP module RAMP protein Cmr1